MNARINVTDLEFDQIKQNLKNFLKGQQQFADFDFEGSNLAVLLDVLAYNTHYNAMYLNMALNEMFLDSDAKRDSVVSLAKGIGYLPRSARCAKVIVNFTINQTSSFPEFVTLPRYSAFRSQIDGRNFIFYTRENHTVSRNQNNQYTFSKIELTEGAPVTNTFLYSEENRYRLTNQRVDLTTLLVRVQQNATSSESVVYRNGNQLADISDQDDVYFIREMENGFYDISFGDNIVGKALVPGNAITIEYFVGSGTAPNGIRNISYSGDTVLSGVITNITLESPVYGGADSEDIESIRNNAPNFWLSQNRAVTENDYRAIILANYPVIRDLKIWGGEKNDPPVYGKVFISATTRNGIPLSFTQKNELVNDVIDKFKVVSVIPELIDPEYIDVELDVAVYFDQTQTRKSIADVKTLVISGIEEYNGLKLQNFSSIIRNSELIRGIETVENSITNVIPRMRLYKKIQPIFMLTHNYVINFGNPIVRKAGSVITNSFMYAESTETVFIDNDIEGNLNLFFLENNQRRVIGAPIGSVNYDTGVIKINGLKLTTLLEPNWIIRVTPASPDVVGKANNIIRLDMSRLKVDVLPEQTNKNRYNFTSARLT